MNYPNAVPTPASRRPRPTVVVLGAGIAGLTAAHELVERGFDVTVYEPRPDERSELGAAPPGGYPPVKLGGLAASQYASARGDHAELRPFPGRRGQPIAPERTVAGEHGFRFFPAYYEHIWDLLQRIPVYQPVGGGAAWHPTPRTVMDNVRRVITQGITVAGKPSLVFPREGPRSLAELLTATNQLAVFGFTPSDMQTFGGRLSRYLVTSPLRRASELQNLSAYDFFIGCDATVPRRFSYTPQFEAQILDMPKVLAAFDSRWGDARTNISTYLQLMLQTDRTDNKADGVLNGPTTESWFDHWYRHLVEFGVRFVRGSVDHLEPPVGDRQGPPHLRPRVAVVLADGTRLAPDYTVVAVDAPAAERITGPLRQAGTGGTVAGLDGFTTSAPPPAGPLQAGESRPVARRDPYAMDQLGRMPWDRFQSLAGIQFYFDTEFQLVRGHMYYSSTEWGLSSINQQGLREKRPILARDGHVAVLSVDIGDFNTPSRHLVDEFGNGKAARDCTADELAVEVWRQIVAAVTSTVDNVPEAVLPWPAWYTLDRYLIMADGPGPGGGRPVRNGAPYLIPIVGDWPNRPGGEPWNPHGSSWLVRPIEERWLEDLYRRDVWQARHGGYQVHHNSVVFAGTWTKTFTRLTSMEAACESARHAVNAILDHYVWVETDGADRRVHTTLDWRFPFGFLDQGLSSPIRQPSPAGDYCFVFDIENHEPLDARGLRNLDSQYYLQALPHPLDTMGPTTVGVPGFPSQPTAGGPPMTTSPNDYTGQLLSYLQAWRQYLEQATSTAPPWPTAPNATPPGQAWPAPSWPVFPTPPMPPVPPPPAATSPAATSPAGPLTPSPGAVSPAPSEVVPPDDKQGGFYPRQPAGTALWTAGELSRESGRESLYSADMTTVPSEPMADPKPGSAYLEAGEPLHDSRSAPSETRSLYSDPGASPSPPTSWEPDRGMDRLGRDLEFGVLPNQTFSVSGTLPAGVVGGGEPGKPVKNDHAPGPPGIQEGFELNRLSVRNKNQ